MKIAVFCSGNGSNFQAIADSVKAGDIKADISVMVCDNPKAFAIERAKKLGIETFVTSLKDHKSRQDFEKAILAELEVRKIELVVLAGFMKVLSADFIAKYKNRIINIHPALLPSFAGTDGIGDAIKYGVKATGVTVHFVDAGVDTGPIILQDAVEVRPDDTHDSLAERIHKIEHQLYPRVVKLFVEGRIKIEGRVVKIT
ncbi:MAG: phosphoribosylglycinamide formyltransferase [Candidatus Omnitrophica bacterium]|nr:phosphoribosylglycinamide formyltransferase [Candidatus Omnitrophota bacterium]